MAYAATGDLLGRDPDSCDLFKSGYRQRLADVTAGYSKATRGADTMAIDDLSAFFARLQQDAALREQALALQDADDAGRLDGLCRLAREHGFDVAPEDWQQAEAETAAASLDDEALRKVAGGGCSAVGSLAFGPSAPLNPMG